MFDKNCFIKYYITDSGRYPELFDIFGNAIKDCAFDIEIENNNLTCLKEKLSKDLSYTNSDKRYEFKYSNGSKSSDESIYKLSIYQNSCDHNDKYEKRTIVKINKIYANDKLSVTTIFLTEEGHMFVFFYNSNNVSNKSPDFDVTWYHFIPETASYFDKYDKIDWNFIEYARELGVLPDDEDTYKVKFKNYEELFSNQESIMKKYVSTLKR